MLKLEIPKNGDILKNIERRLDINWVPRFAENAPRAILKNMKT